METDLAADVTVELCHCRLRLVHTYEDGFTRGMCEPCSSVRCDLGGGCPPLVELDPDLDRVAAALHAQPHTCRRFGAAPCRACLENADAVERLSMVTRLEFVLNKPTFVRVERNGVVIAQGYLHASQHD